MAVIVVVDPLLTRPGALAPDSFPGHRLVPLDRGRPPEDAAEALAEASPSALGLDFAVDDTWPWPNHTILLGVGVLLIENLIRLPELPRDGFDVMAFPLRLVGENGGPARVVVELGR